jgi:hypothetical protein
VEEEEVMERRTSTPIRLFSPLFRRVTLTPASILLPTLFVTSLISLSILSFLLGLFLLHRLYLNLQSSTGQCDSSKQGGE